MIIKLQRHQLAIAFFCLIVEQASADMHRARLINWTTTKPREGPPIYVCIYAYTGHQFHKTQRHVCESTTAIPEQRESSSYGMMLTDEALNYLQKIFN